MIVSLYKRPRAWNPFTDFKISRWISLVLGLSVTLWIRDCSWRYPCGQPIGDFASRIRPRLAVYSLNRSIPQPRVFGFFQISWRIAKVLFVAKRRGLLLYSPRYLRFDLNWVESIGEGLHPEAFRNLIRCQASNRWSEKSLGFRRLIEARRDWCFRCLRSFWRALFLCGGLNWLISVE